MSAHTPGPWTWEHSYRAGYIRIITLNAPDVLSRCWDIGFMPEHDANLIVAAPDMLKALKQLLIRADLRSEDGWIEKEALAAIAKAEGRV